MSHYRSFAIQFIRLTLYQRIGGTYIKLPVQTPIYTSASTLVTSTVVFIAKKVHYHLIPQPQQSTAQSFTNYIIVE